MAPKYPKWILREDIRDFEQAVKLFFPRAALKSG